MRGKWFTAERVLLRAGVGIGASANALDIDTPADGWLVQTNRFVGELTNPVTGNGGANVTYSGGILFQPAAAWAPRQELVKIEGL